MLDATIERSRALSKEGDEVVRRARGGDLLYFSICLIIKLYKPIYIYIYRRMFYPHGVRLLIEHLH